MGLGIPDGRPWPAMAQPWLVKWLGLKFIAVAKWLGLRFTAVANWLGPRFTAVATFQVTLHRPPFHRPPFAVTLHALQPPSTLHTPRNHPSPLHGDSLRPLFTLSALHIAVTLHALRSLHTRCGRQLSRLLIAATLHTFTITLHLFIAVTLTLPLGSRSRLSQVPRHTQPVFSPPLGEGLGPTYSPSFPSPTSHTRFDIAIVRRHLENFRNRPPPYALSVLSVLFVFCFFLSSFSLLCTIKMALLHTRMAVLGNTHNHAVMVVESGCESDCERRGCEGHEGCKKGKSGRNE